MEKRALGRSYQVADLIHKHLDQRITEEERLLLEEWLQEKVSNRELFLELVKKDGISHAVDRMREIEEEKNNVLPDIMSRINAPGSSPASFHLRRWQYTIAAGVLICVCIATLFYINRRAGPGKSSTPVVADSHQHDIPPGTNKATLTLADGTVITLDSASNGTLAQQGGARVIKLDSGRLAYEGNKAAAGREVLYNTIYTPRGGQYQITLPDGSQAWLNAASSLRFPAMFTNGERKVEVSGEVYFEIATLSDKRKKKVPFVIDVKTPSAAGNARITVLGTHFNVMAYDDEKAVEVTLLEGAVNVTGAQEDSRLQPGQQAQLNKQGTLKLIAHADIAAVMAWKNGLFQFHNADLPAVLRQLSRWYDVDIEYKGPVPHREFEGEIQRDLTLSQVLRILEKNQVNIRIEGKKMVVMP
jgi:ferric-dicitrate binding protein FerR (iron transport regulator)